MSSLQFLNKKSWHVKTRKNEEKVWLREQAAEKEAARVAELQKQLVEERKLEEIRRLEQESGNGPVSQPAPRIDWMYEGPGTADPNAASDQEALLLGQKEAKLAPSGSGQHPGSALVDATAATVAASNMAGNGPPQVANELDPYVLRDAEAKLREDPLLAIRKHEKESMERIISRHALNRERVVAVKSAPTRKRPALDLMDEERQAQKRTRKEERARIREERRARRKGRVMEVGLKASTTHEKSNSPSDDDHAALTPKSSARADTCRQESESGDELDRTHPSKRPRQKGSREHSPGRRLVPKLASPLRHAVAMEYRIGKGEVEEPIRTGKTYRVEPMSRDMNGPNGDPGHLEISSASSHRPPRRGRTELSEEERKRRLEEMQRDAQTLDDSRAARIRREEHEELRFHENSIHSRNDLRDRLAPSFVYELSRDALERRQSSRPGFLRQRESMVDPEIAE